jgi:hypothetical protein
MKKTATSIAFIAGMFSSSIQINGQIHNYFAGLVAGSGNTGSYCTGVGE